MESRKVQRSGKSSFVVSLPSDWVKAYDIRKNAPVSMEINVDGSLQIFPKEAKRIVGKPLTLSYSSEREKTFLLRKMIGAYIAGYRSIELKSSEANFKGAVSLASEFTSMTVGQEIVEESPQKIVIKDILSPSELPMEKVLQRMSNISRKMLSDSILAIEQKSSCAVSPTNQLEADIDRLWRLMARKQNMFLQSPSSASGENITLARAQLYFLSARIMERVADYSLHVCSCLPLKPAPKSRENALDRLVELGKECELAYERANKAVFTLDPMLANSVIEDVGAIDAVFERMMLEPPPQNPRLISLRHYVKRAARYGAEMCEEVIDFAFAN